MTAPARFDALVTTDWLAVHAYDSDVRVIDATYHLPHLKRNARGEYAAEHIPGAVFFDVDTIADKSTSLPHMLPPPDAFAASVGALGIGDDDLVVAYDTYGLLSAARAWWMFRIFGHDRVAVLDGGLPKWKREGRPVAASETTPQPRRFTSRFRPDLVRSRSAIVSNLTTKAEQIVDARSSGRFRGADPEPRPGLRGGHIPGSRNVPLNLLVDDQTKTLLPAARLREVFVAAGVDPAAPTAASCGSGVTACGLALGLYLLGNDKVAVYDGSWAEWGLSGTTPVETT